MNQTFALEVPQGGWVSLNVGCGPEMCTGIPQGAGRCPERVGGPQRQQGSHDGWENPPPHCEVLHNTKHTRFKRSTACKSRGTVLLRDTQRGAASLARWLSRLVMLCIWTPWTLYSLPTLMRYQSIYVGVGVRRGGGAGCLTADASAVDFRRASQPYIDLPDRYFEGGLEISTVGFGKGT